MSFPLASICTFFAILAMVNCAPIETTTGFRTVILEKNDTLCNGTLRCVIIENVDTSIERRATKSGSSSSSSNKNDDDKDEEQENDDIIKFVPAIMYTGKYEIARIIEQFLMSAYENETFTFLDNRVQRRRAYAWDWSSSVNCKTTRTGTNSSVFTTTCSDSGRINEAQTCFSSDGFMYIEVNDSYSQVQMKNAEKYYGNNMITYNNNQITQSRFMTYVHIDHHITTTFIKIVLGTTKLYVTKNHLVYVLKRHCVGKNVDFEKCSVRVFANEVEIGDYMFVIDRDIGNLITEKIVSLKNIVKTGIFSPVPENGHDFFVNNVLVSPYSYTNTPFFNSIHYAYAWMVSFMN